MVDGEIVVLERDNCHNVGSVLFHFVFWNVYLAGMVRFYWRFVWVQSLMDPLS